MAASQAGSSQDAAGEITRLILSTGNIMTTGPTHIGHRPIFEKSNTELINSLRTSFVNARSSIHESNTSSLTNGVSSRQTDTESPSNRSWTSTSANNLHIPSPVFSLAPLAEERSSYDITLKLFYLPSAKGDAASRSAHAKEALNLVLTALNVPDVDLLIVSFPGISFDADDTGDDEDEDDEDPKDDADDLPATRSSLPPLTRTLTAEDRLVQSVTQTWHGIEALHAQNLVMTLGVAEFGNERLERFLPLTTVRPGVDQINVRDCCVVPKPLILYARSQGIQLLTHNDCTDILPTGSVRELLKEVFPEADQDGINDKQWLRGNIVPQWVIKYTAVVRDRGVIENKGYFAMAEVEHQSHHS